MPERSTHAEQSVLPLVIGSRGEPVRDLQQRLTSLGYDIDPSELGQYGPTTEEAVRRFQERRGLLPNGSCDATTWAALVEAGYRLGDRLLYLRSPMLRGDDVAALQLRLGALGFDAGRVDGIFGPDTEAALKDFQRNTGLTTDGVCGRDVLATLERLGGKIDLGSNVADVRERDRLRHAPRVLDGRRVAIGDAGGLDVVVSAVARDLHEKAAVVAVLNHSDPSIQAQEANSFHAEVYLGLAFGDQGLCRCTYYATTGFESAGGHRLADVISCMLERHAGLPVAQSQGMRLPILRETRMPAVMCYLGPVDLVVERTAAVAEALVEALAQWVAEPVES
ncbi:MAG: peptidoglycan-binding protein [Acidimicrobiales bacterium]